MFNIDLEWNDLDKTLSDYVIIRDSYVTIMNVGMLQAVADN